jgi:hypothetical protein
MGFRGPEAMLGQALGFGRTMGARDLRLLNEAAPLSAFYRTPVRVRTLDG